MKKTNKMAIVAAMVLMAACLALVIFAMGKDADPQDGSTTESLPLTTPEEEAPTAAEVSADLASILDNYFAETGVDTSALGIAIYDFESGGSYAWNDMTYFTAASTYKLPLAMIYYEMVANGECALSDELVYEAYQYEEGGTICYDYSPGSSISIEELLHCMIVDSDNTAAHILFENLGGWVAFKEAISKYSDVAIDENDSVYYSFDNVFTPAFMEDVLDYLYAHKDNFSTLLDDMLQSEPDDYLNMNIGDKMAQKYGQYEEAENAIGISMSGHPYSIAVYTSLGYTGRLLIGELNAMIWDYFNEGYDGQTDASADATEGNEASVEV